MGATPTSMVTEHARGRCERRERSLRSEPWAPRRRAWSRSLRGDGASGVIRLWATVRSVVVLGAHCDDIAIGAGGTLLTLCDANPGLRVDALVLSGGGTARADEENAALRAFCPGADLDVTVHKVPDGRLPAHWDE